ncbi:MAG: VCBS repeat-containing protein [Ignavibacteria bacterium]|nr:VCBS repeat-containing protein [Ignavibacteria bacterium]
MKKYLFILPVLFLTVQLLQAQDFAKVSPSVIDFESAASRSVNWIDYDNDNDLDLFITTGKQGGDDNLLYRNDNGIFVRIYDQPIVNDSLPSDGSSWGDFNNDGLPDLCVVNWYNKPALLYTNNGGGNFTFKSASPVTNQNGYSETCTWGDYDNDGLIDLFITNSAGTNHRNYLYRNTGNSNFLRVDTGIVVSEIGRSRGANWVDIDNDRDLDLFVCREINQNEYLYQNNGNGYFTKITDSPLTTNAGESWSGSWGDYDNDGDLDVFVTNSGNQNNFLFRNEGNFNFTKITNDPIVSEPGYNAVSGWGDYDNDGDLDMFITQAYVGPSFTQKAVNKLYKNLLMESGSASFQKITAGEIVSDSGYSYGFAWGDYDNDGDLDVAVANTFDENQKNALYKNELSNGNKWISITCKGTSTNRSAIGTKVRVKAIINGNSVWQLQEVDGQSGYCGQNLMLHFGLGNTTVIDSIKVEWPAGGDQYFTNVTVNQSVTIIENGTLISVGENTIEQPQDFKLHQNFPNPFNPSTVINYELTSFSNVELKVYDILGNEVETLVNDLKQPGIHSVSFNGSSYPSGVYYYRLDVRNSEGVASSSESKKMIMLK